MDKVNKLLVNKYFLYFVLLVTASNLLGYLSMGDINSVVFFGMVAGLSSYYTNNMTVIMLITLFTTSLFVIMRRKRKMKEGMDDDDDDDDDDEERFTLFEGMENQDETEKDDSSEDLTENMESENIHKNHHLKDVETLDMNMKDMMEKVNSDDFKDAAQNIIETQKNLATTIENMAPLMESSKNMIKSMKDMGFGDLMKKMNLNM